MPPPLLRKTDPYTFQNQKNWLEFSSDPDPCQAQDFSLGCELSLLGTPFLCLSRVQTVPGAAVCRQGPGPEELPRGGVGESLGSLGDAEEAGTRRGSSGEGGDPGGEAPGDASPGRALVSRRGAAVCAPDCAPRPPG